MPKAKTETEGKPELTTISTPDISKLPSVAFASMMAFRVTDDVTAELAAQEGRVAQSYITSVEALFDEPTSAANKVHKFLTGMRGKLLKPAQEAVTHLRKEVQGYRDSKEQERLAEERRLQAQRDEEARREAEAKRQSELAEAMPWEQEEVESKPLEAFVEHRERIALAPHQIDGVSTRKSPWTYEVTDLRALLKAIVENKIPLEDWLDGERVPIVQVNHALFQSAAKRLQASLGDKYPGVKGVQKENVRF